MERRTIVALILVALIMILYPMLVKKYYPQKQTQAITEPATITQAPESIIEEIEGAKQEEEIKVETEKHILLFTNLGGNLKGVWLKDYKTETGAPTKLFSVDSPSEAAFATSEIDPAFKNQSQPYTYKQDECSIEFTLQQQGATKIQKKYYFSKQRYDVDMDMTITNLSDYPKVYKYKVNAGASEQAKGMLEKRYVQVDSLIDGKIIRKGLSSVKKRDLVSFGKVEWSALNSRYFSVILRPNDPAEASIAKSLPDNRMQVQIETSPVTLESNQSVTQRYLLYAGPNKIEELKQYGLGLEEVVNFGIFSPISKFILMIMKFFTKIIPNWGIAIILMTVVISLALYPLTFKSLKSMKQMQAIQPHIQELRKLYKDDPQKLNKEIMDLYKKNKVNPLGGCLPMILQMPIFISLYQLLVRSIELKGANFLWIKDLANPDQFIKLNFTLPVIGNYINLLPLLTIGVMFFQQRMSSGQTKDSQQKMLSVMMPIMFGFIFYNFPAGFLLYFMTSTLLMLFYQSRMKVAKND